MSIERAIVEFFGASATALAAGRAGRAVPRELAADPTQVFRVLVETRGVAEMQRHVARLTRHVIEERKAGRLADAALADRISLLASRAAGKPPAADQMTRVGERSGTPSTAASALLLAASIVSRIEAEKPLVRSGLEATWATDMIAEALAGMLADADFLAGLDRVFSRLAANAPPASPHRTMPPPRPQLTPTPAQAADRRAAPPPSGADNHHAAAADPLGDLVGREATAQSLTPRAVNDLIDACRRQGIGEERIAGIVHEKASTLKELAARLKSLEGAAQSDPLIEGMRGQALTAVLDGDLTAAAALLSGIEARLLNAGESALPARVAADIHVACGLLDEALLQPRAAAGHYAAALEAAPRQEPSLRWSIALRQGAALVSEAEQHGSQRALDEAIRVYARALGLMPAEQAPDLWLVTQNCLGNALLRLGEAQGKGDLLELAANAYRSAAGVMDRTRSPREWALVQSNLGTALLKAGERVNPERNYDEAAACFDRALEQLSWDGAPADWAAAEAGRGMARGRLGAIRGDLAMLERTARSVDTALARSSRQLAPSQWARLQSCLGNICADLGERIGGRHWLERAVKAYAAAQEEWTRERAPLQWALSEANRATALWALGTLAGIRRLQEEAQSSLEGVERMFLKLGQEGYAAAARESRTALAAGVSAPSVAEGLHAGGVRA